jgi:copper chaperone
MVKLKIEGMSCDHCVRAVTRALEGVAGVERVREVNLAHGEALIEGTPDVPAAIRAIAAEGYVARCADD